MIKAIKHIIDTLIASEAERLRLEYDIYLSNFNNYSSSFGNHPGC